MQITRFEDIEAWQVSRRLSYLVFAATAEVGFRRQSELRSQLRRAATSAMANIAEGFNAGSDAEFSRFLRISRKSATEIQSHLYSALDTGSIDDQRFSALYGKAEEVKRLIGGFIRYLSESRHEGPRPKTED
jgi:four helix bundle protein